MNPIEKKRKNNFLVHTSKRYVNLLRKQKILIKKNLIYKIHKLIVKKVKFNINDHIKTYRNHNLLQI
jgi:hypothetical protein